MREGLPVAIVGPPNAGKSSLLNALLGMDRAIVSEIPGTTRDTIEESIAIEGVPVRLIDTAGIRAHADRLEARGIERTDRALAAARIALLVIDGSEPLGSDALALLERTRGRERIVFYNKADLGTRGASGSRRSKARSWAASARRRRWRRCGARSRASAGAAPKSTRRARIITALYEFDAVNAAVDALGARVRNRTLARAARFRRRPSRSALFRRSGM